MSQPFARQLADLARYMAWADATVWDAVRSADTSAADAKIAETLHHVHQVQHIFLQAWTRAPFTIRERSEFRTLDGLAAWGADAHRGVLSFLEGVTDEELNRELRLPWAAHFEERSKQPAGAHTLGESVFQVVLHTQHHRGQICTRLRQLGAEPPTIDFIVWLWAGKPVGALRV